jgi:hypothetical protein
VQAEVTLRQDERGIVADGAERLGPARTADGLGDEARVRGAAHPVGDDAGHAQIAIERLEAEHDRARAAGQGRGVEHEQHRRVEPPGDLGRGAIRADTVHAVEAAHHALDHDDVGVPRSLRDRVEHALAPAHPAVEVVRRPAGHSRVQTGIDEVGPDLEGLHGEPTAAQRLEQPEGDRGLAHPAGHTRHDHDPGAHAGPSTPADLNVAMRL